MKPHITFITQRNSGKSGIDTYTSLVLSVLENQKKYNVEIVTPRYFSHYPLTFKKGKGILHVTSQDLAFPLVFKKYEQCIVTVHDIIPLVYPLFEQARHLRLKWFNIWMYKETIRALRKAAHIICVSHATKKSLLTLYPQLEEKITVIHEYPQEKFKVLSKRREKYDILYVGSEMPHKNLATLIKAFAKVRLQFPQARLIKIGQSKWLGAREELIRLARSLQCEEGIYWKDEITDLVQAYNKATVYVQPSLQEGFGLPVVEAMACGCPVIISKIPALQEVAGDAASSFTHDNVDELAEAIITLFKDKGMQAQMSLNGQEQIKKYNQETFKKMHLMVYNLINRSNNGH